MSRGGRFGEFFLAPVAVVADRRRRHERLRLDSRLGDALHEMSRADDAAIADSCLLGRGPTPLGHRFSGEVQHDIHTLEDLRRRRPLHRIPPVDRAGQIAQGRPGAVGVPGEDDGTIEHPQKPGTHETCCACHQCLHGSALENADLGVHDAGHDRCGVQTAVRHRGRNTSRPAGSINRSPV